MKRIQTRDLARRALTNFISMSPWPLEMSGAFVLWHYGKLFTSSQVLSNDFNSVIAQLMPGESWGVFARSLAYFLVAIGVVGLLTGARPLRFASGGGHRRFGRVGRDGLLVLAHRRAVRGLRGVGGLRRGSGLRRAAHQNPHSRRRGGRRWM